MLGSKTPEAPLTETQRISVTLLALEIWRTRKGADILTLHEFAGWVRNNGTTPRTHDELSQWQHCVELAEAVFTTTRFR